MNIRGEAGRGKWVIFDADNTLWDVEALYDSARHEFCFQVAKLSDKDVEEIEAHQRETDRNLKKTYGYSASRFARSFEDTLHHFIPNPRNDLIAKVRKIAERVFYEKAEVYPELEDVLRGLCAAGFKLGIVTAGEEWVQRWRLDDFHLRPLFHALKIVDSKSKGALDEFCERNLVGKEESFFIGDSVDSDIIPAHEAGLTPVLLRGHHHWQEGETKEVPNSVDCVELNYVTDLQDYLDLDPIEYPHVPRKVPAFGIFEGGGAKGLAHVGVLAFLEERKFDLEAVAGTSAGALVAGLCAAGYTSYEIYHDEPTPGGLLDFDYLEVLGAEEWKRAEDFILDVTERASDLINSSGRISGLRAWMRLGSFLNSNKDDLASFNSEKGYFSLDDFRDRYDSWLKTKLIEKGRINTEEQGPVKFKNLVKDLYIVSTDVTGKKLKVFSNQTDPDQDVAEAVTASICIPAVFRPRDLSTTRQPNMHVDGGLLSNFPAWLFSTDPLRANPGKEFVPVFGVELQEKTDTTTPPPQGLFGFATDLVRTAVAGNKHLETRDMRRLLKIPVPVSVDTYAFDMGSGLRQKTYGEGKEAARLFFEKNLHAVSPRLIQPFLADIHSEMLATLQKLAKRKSIHLRVNIMTRVPPDEVILTSEWPQQQQIEILYHYNMDLDPDVVITFGPEEGGVGACFKERRIRKIDLEWSRDAYDVYGMTAVQQALVRKGLKSLMCIPMFDPNAIKITDETPIIGILNFDSDDKIVLDLFSNKGIKKDAIRMARIMANTWCDLAEKGDTAHGRQKG